MKIVTEIFTLLFQKENDYLDLRTLSQDDIYSLLTKDCILIVKQIAEPSSLISERGVVSKSTVDESKELQSLPDSQDDMSEIPPKERKRDQKLKRKEQNISKEDNTEDFVTCTGLTV